MRELRADFICAGGSGGVMKEDLFGVSKKGRRATLFVDGASRGNPGPAAIGVVLENGNHRALKEFGRCIGETTNNVAEYTALVMGLEEAIREKVGEITVYTDSELLARQLQGRYRVREPRLLGLHEQARALIKNFLKCGIHHIPREKNRKADKLANQALDAVKKRVDPVIAPSPKRGEESPSSGGQRNG